MYTFWKRAAPPASMDIFNAPNREHCVDAPRADQHAAAGAGDAERSAVRRSGPAAGRAGDARRRRTSTSGIDFIAERLLARPLAAEELAIVQASLEKFAAALRGRTPRTRSKLIDVGESNADATMPPAELAAWTMVANELMNLDEVLNK